MGNALRIVIAFALIKLVRVPWHFGQRLTRRQFPIVDHYIILKIFAWLFRSYPVMIQYSNPISSDGQRLTLSLDLCANSQLVYFRMKSNYELEWIKLVGLAMVDAEMFVDVGANIGVYAIATAKAFPGCQIVAIEPLPDNYSKLEQNVRLNHISNIKPIRAVVSENNRPVSFYVSPIHDGGGSIIASKEYRTGDVRLDAAEYQEKHPEFTPTLEVESLRLDDIITNRSVLKVDVEGAEATVLRSGTAALKSELVDLAVVEVTEDSVDEVVGILDEVKFDCFVYGQSSPITNASQFGMRLGNLLCLRRQSQIYHSILNKVAARMA